MEFANTTYLWGLFGLLLPIGIHLWSRKKVITIKVGSTKLLETSKPKQTRSVKLNELWLLFSRLLTVFLLVLILAEPIVSKRSENVSINYLIEPSLIDDARMESFLNTVPKESVRILARDFPFYENYTTTETERIPAYWQLAQDMNSIEADSLVVFSQGLLKGLKGIRPIIQANTKWIVLEKEKGFEKSIAAIQKKNYVEVLSVSSNASGLKFKKDSVSIDSDVFEINTITNEIRLKSADQKGGLKIFDNLPFRIGIQYEDSLKGQVPYLQAAYRAISKFLNIPIEVEILKTFSSDNAYDYHTSIVLGGVVLENIKGTVLQYKPNEFATKLIENGLSSHSYHLTSRLNSENIETEHLPEKLLALLNRNEHLTDSLKIYDQRTVAENEIQPLRSSEKKIIKKVSQFEIAPWLWLFLILVIIIERFLAKLRKQ